MRALDKAREIGDDKRAAEFGAVATGAAVGIDDAQIWRERGKRIICDFRTRGRNYGNQGGFACVWEAYETDIGEKFQFETKMPLFPGSAVLVFAGSLVPGLGKILIAAAAAATLGDQHALSGNGQVGNGFAGLFIVSQRADGNQQDHVRAGVAGAVRSFAVTATISLEFAIVAVAQQRVVVGIRFEIDAAAVSAVASGRAAAGDEFFAAKRDAAVAAAAGLH